MLGRLENHDATGLIIHKIDRSARNLAIGQTWASLSTPASTSASLAEDYLRSRWSGLDEPMRILRASRSRVDGA